MGSSERVREGLGAVLTGGGGALGSADRLCHACVDLLEVDGAAISLIYEGATRGTFGSSGELSRRLDELQFTFGEGPCLDAVSEGRPVLVPDLRDPRERRWPALAGAILDSGVQAVFAFPVTIARSRIGALDLFRSSPGLFDHDTLGGAEWAAELAALPLLDLMSADADWAGAGDGGDGWSHLASLERVEVYQATGMIQAQLGVGPAEALVRLRAFAFSNDMSASEVAWGVIERRVIMVDDRDPGGDGPPGSGSAP